MRTSSQFRQKLERIFGVALSTHRHDHSIGTCGVCRCE
jgi:hypothetical protein